MGSFQELLDMVPLAVNCLCDFFPALFLLNLAQKNGFLGWYRGLVFIGLIHAWHILLLLAFKQQPALHSIPLLQEIGCFLQVLQFCFFNYWQT
jgi:hypothetical protein